MSAGRGCRVAAWCCALLVALSVWSLPVPAAAADAAKLVLVLDSSGSMKARVDGASKISIAKSALNTVVDRLPPEAAVGLRVYGATVFSRSDPGACSDSQLVVPIGAGNRDELKREIARYKPYGETPISYSLRQAAQDLGTEGKRTILLVSDGEETCKEDPCATAAAIAKNKIDVKIDVVGLAVSGRTRSQLQCVASRGNGTYYDADSRVALEDSLDKLSTRAFRPFRLTGTPIEGSMRKSTAPTAVPGQYVDTFPGSTSPLYYRVPRSARGSTVHVGFTTRPPGGPVPTVSLRLRDATGAECDWDVAQAISIGGRSPLVTGEVSSWASTEESDCNTEPQLLLEVSGASQDLAGEKFELVIVEEPPLVSTRGLPPAVESTTWQQMTQAKTAARPPVAGSSLSDAPALAPGMYRTTILTGETQVYAVAADWGQRVQVEVRVAPRRGALARALGISDSMNLQLLGALRGEYKRFEVRRLPKRSVSMAVDDQPYVVAAGTPPIRYLNRGRGSSAAAADVPGPQYLVVNMSQHGDDQFLVPYTVAVTVLGTAGQGRPEYATSATPSPTPTPTPTPIPSPSPAVVTPSPSSVPPSTGSSGVSLPVVVAIGAGALTLGAVGAVAATVIGGRRRRRAG